MSKGWIGVDLDGTLAHYDGWIAPDHIGDPIDAMVQRVKRWLDEGRTVKIFTARVSYPGNDHQREQEAGLARIAIQDWCREVFGFVLDITCEKDFGMVTLYDDRCRQVELNTGQLIGAQEQE